MDLIWNGFPIYVSGPFSSEDEERNSLKRLILLYDQQDKDKEKETGNTKNWKDTVLLSEEFVKLETGDSPTLKGKCMTGIMFKINFMTEVQNVLRCNDIGYLCSMVKKYAVPNIILHPFENVMSDVCDYRRKQLKLKRGTLRNFSEKYWWQLYEKCCQETERL